MGNNISSHTSKRAGQRQMPDQAESSRVLFLLYLIHRTWNIVLEHVDTSKSGRWRGSRTVPSSNPAQNQFDSISLDTDSGSNYSFCSCSYCQLKQCANECVRCSLYRNRDLYLYGYY